MLSTIFIIIGAVLTAIGVFGLIRIAFEPIQKAFEVVFGRRQEHILYESGAGRRLLEKESRILITVCIVFIVVGLFFLGFGLTFKYANRGNDSLLSKNTEGIAVGDASSFNPQAQGRTASGRYISKTGTEYTYFIKITGNNILLNDVNIANVEELEEYLKNIDRTTTICVVDDFGASGTYNKVRKILDDQGMTYEFEEE